MTRYWLNPISYTVIKSPIRFLAFCCVSYFRTYATFALSGYCNCCYGTYSAFAWLQLVQAQNLLEPLLVFIDIFLLFYSKIFWLFYYYYFQDILIILLLFCLFWFNRGYSVNDRLDFALTVIKRVYNANDSLKFILPFIRWDNSLNDRLKLVKNGRKQNKNKEKK